MNAARGRADRAAVLLRAGDPVRKTIIGSAVIDLRGRLVVPRTRGCRAVDADDSALVAAGDHAFRIRGIGPELMVVVAARRPFDWRPRFACVSRTIDRR